MQILFFIFVFSFKSLSKVFFFGLRPIILLIILVLSIGISLIPFPFLGLPGQWVIIAFLCSAELLLYTRNKKIIDCIIKFAFRLQSLQYLIILKKFCRERKNAHFRILLKIISSPGTYLKLQEMNINKKLQAS